MTNAIYLQSNIGNGYHQKTTYAKLANNTISKDAKCYIYNKNSFLIEKKGKIHKQPAPIIFEYSNLPYNIYLTGYDSKGWIERKLMAIPFTLISMISLTCHIVFEAFYLITNMFDKLLYPKISPYTKNEIRLLQYQFSIIRDLEEIAGYLLIIPFDTYGKYLIEKSLFHKEAYFIAANN